MRLTRSRIITTARVILETEGPEAVTMRRIGRELGSAPMSLYHHVGSRAELMMAVLNEIAAEMPRPVLPDDPREGLVVIATYMHSVLKRLPTVLDALIRREGFGLDALWLNDRFLALAGQAGLSERQAVHLFRTVWLFVTGSLLDGRTVERTGEDARDAPAVTIDASRYPALARMLPNWPGHEASYDVRAELASIVDGHLARAVARPAADEASLA